MQLSREQLEHAYRLMRTIRTFEERVHSETQKGQIPGSTHLYAGQESVAVGVCMNLTGQDHIISTHRGHGRAIAKGCEVGPMSQINRCAQSLHPLGMCLLQYKVDERGQ